MPLNAPTFPPPAACSAPRMAGIAIHKRTAPGRCCCVPILTAKKMMMPSHFLRTFFLLPLLAVLVRFFVPAAHAVSIAPATSPPDNEHYVVSYIVDGDSLWVRTAGSTQNTHGARTAWRGKGHGQRLRVRLRGIDAPELCQQYGTQARDALRALAPTGQRVRVTIYARDRYGRAIADVILLPDGINLARHMVAQGWAWDDGGRKRRGLYTQEHRQAVQARRGLFADDGAERPADFRRRYGSCHTGG